MVYLRNLIPFILKTCFLHFVHISSTPSSNILYPDCIINWIYTVPLGSKIRHFAKDMSTIIMS